MMPIASRIIMQLHIKECISSISTPEKQGLWEDILGNQKECDIYGFRALVTATPKKKHRRRDDNQVIIIRASEIAACVGTSTYILNYDDDVRY